MSVLSLAPRRSSGTAVVAAAALMVVVGCASMQRTGAPSAASAPRGDLSPNEQVAHVLSRLTFGARPGDAERVAAMGIDKWIDQQLRPETISDSAAIIALAPLSTWSDAPFAQGAEVATLMRLQAPPFNPADSVKRRMAAQQIRVLLGSDDQFLAGKIIRAQTDRKSVV